MERKGAWYRRAEQQPTKNGRSLCALAVAGNYSHEIDVAQKGKGGRDDAMSGSNFER